MRKLTSEPNFELFGENKKATIDNVTGTKYFYKLLLAEAKLENSRVKLNARNVP